MEGIIDIHTHILPGVDDGAAGKEEARRMLEIAAEDGITGIIVTPHYYPGRYTMPVHKIRAAYDQLLERNQDILQKISVYLGSEVMYYSGCTVDLDTKVIYSMASGRYVLIEFPPSARCDEIRRAVSRMVARGYLPVLAHIERYAVMKDPAEAERLIDMGAYIQLNAGSVMGRYGYQAKRLCRELLRQELVHFIASDAHDMTRRKPELSKCAAYVGRKFGEDYARTLFYDNAEKLIQNKII